MSRCGIIHTGVVLLLGFLVLDLPANAKGVAQETKALPVLVEVEGKLLEYEEKYIWCNYEDGASTHGLFESPWARFEITGPGLYAGRTFGVIFECNKPKDFLPTLQSGKGRLFVLVLPQDFLRGRYSRIEDCTIDAAAITRWRAVEGVGRAR